MTDFFDAVALAQGRCPEGFVPVQGQGQARYALDAPQSRWPASFPLEGALPYTVGFQHASAISGLSPEELDEAFYGCVTGDWRALCSPARTPVHTTFVLALVNLSRCALAAGISPRDWWRSPAPGKRLTRLELLARSNRTAKDRERWFSAASALLDRTPELPPMLARHPRTDTFLDGVAGDPLLAL